jgi:hypothetical protein
VISENQFETNEDSFNYFEFDNNFLKTNNIFFVKNFIFSKLIQLTPIFSFFIYNVDKNIKKFTRGKSGKYVFI